MYSVGTGFRTERDATRGHRSLPRQLRLNAYSEGLGQDGRAD